MHALSTLQFVPEYEEIEAFFKLIFFMQGQKFRFY